MKDYTYWMHGMSGEPGAVAPALADQGFDVVVAGGAENIAAVRAAGMRSWLCGGAFGLGGRGDDYKAVSVTGEPVVWFNSGCPNNPEIREANLEAYRGMASTDGVEGVLVDGCRFASPASGLEAFFTCFCDTCRKKAGALGFDFDAMKRDAGALHALVTRKDGEAPGWLATPVGLAEWLTEHPGILAWLRFRRACSTEHFRAIEKIIHGAKREMGVYVFTPSLAPLVGQSYRDLRDLVDVFAPMIYRNYPKRPGPACLNWELTILPEEAGVEGTPGEEAAMDLLLKLTGLDSVVSARTVASVREALPPEAVGHETRLARDLIGDGPGLVPIIYIDDPEMARTGRLVREAGANGVNFFVFKDAWREMAGPAFA